MDATVVYYTSNREDENFEQRIRDNLLKVIGDLPLISVSHKPLDFGQNICVGMQHACDANLYRQLLIGAEAAKTKYIINAEADCLYPPEYFQLEPTEFMYRYTNVWIYFSWKLGFYKKEFSECAQIADRTFLIESITKAMEGRPYWSSPEDPRFPQVYKKRAWYNWETDIPVINVKTGDGLRPFTGTIKGLEPVHEFPYWGTDLDIRKELFE